MARDDWAIAVGVKSYFDTQNFGGFKGVTQGVTTDEFGQRTDYGFSQEIYDAYGGVFAKYEDILKE